MGSNYRLTFHVDIVFCIDATESMDPVLDSVKNNALNFYRDFQQVMEQKHKRVDQLRVRVVVFRDYLADGRQAMLVTNFFTLPDQSSELETCLRSIEAKGGGDDPEYVDVVDDRLGMNLSLSCIRLSLENARWIYKNIPTGTTLVVYE